MMYRLVTAVFAILLLAGCGATEEVAEDVGINGDDDDVVVTTEQEVMATDAVPEGTILNARLDDRISPETVDEGDRFRARVTNNLYAEDGDVLVPEGAVVSGTITGITEDDEIDDQAAVRLDFDDIAMWDRQYDFEAEIVETSAETGGGIEGEDVGIGAAAGAALGAILGGDLGDALLGGALGAGAGTLVSLGTGEEEPVLPSGTVMTLETEDRINI